MHLRALLGAAAPAALALVLGALPAQARRAEVLRPQTPVQINPATQRTDLIVVKFVEGHAVRLDLDGTLSATALDLGAVRQLIGDRRVERVFTRSVEDLERERRVLEAGSHQRLPDLNNYYFVHTSGRADSEALLDDLLADPSVETAYAEPGPGGIVELMPDIPPTTPLFEDKQTFFAAAPAGLGHRQTRAIDGAEGLGRQLVAQLEGAWILGHEDAENLITKNIIGTPSFGSYNSGTWPQHGTACFGLLNATRNAYGTRGFAPLARGRVCSLANGATNMISLATAAAAAGDVFTSSVAYRINFSWDAPFDYFQSNFDAIKLATAKGICYTFGAGNSGIDLGTTSVYGNRYVPSAPDSGGFIIGGTDGSKTSRASGSNYGVKVIANGWSSGVTTLGYGDLFQAGTDGRQNYRRSFGGTSAAAPQVAGVIASLQGAMMRQNDAPLTPDQVRTLLTVHGTSVTGTIGLRPDLIKLMKAAGALDGLRVTREAEIGKPLDTELEVAAGRLYVMLGAVGRKGTNVSLNRKLLLDLSSLFIATGGVVDATGTAKITFPIPNDAALRSKSLFLQILDMSATVSDLHLTNSIEGYIQ